ncbi:hypothetical protein PVAP13_1KG110891 [Panicum virgatum]|uniref:Uncharacterized protein n=1 Tax=Panicum virgatum TaxID=38727 RepID=A0A8T0XU73_PANVG|nr:hypothetical protein PVAP13_1KG110891 [Panicum virgatum]
MKRLRWGPLFFLFLSPPRIHLWPPPSPSAPHPESPIRTQGRRQPAIPPSVLVRRSPLRAPPFAAAVYARPPVATPSAVVRRRPRALVHRWPLRVPALPGKIRRSELEAAELEAAGEERGRREIPPPGRSSSSSRAATSSTGEAPPPEGRGRGRDGQPPTRTELRRQGAGSGAGGGPRRRGSGRARCRRGRGGPGSRRWRAGAGEGARG